MAVATPKKASEEQLEGYAPLLAELEEVADRIQMLSGSLTDLYQRRKELITMCRPKDGPKVTQATLAKHAKVTEAAIIRVLREG